jgi:CRISPR-associated protein Csd1
VKAVNRNRAEGDVTNRRAALIKLILTTQGVNMDNMEALNATPNLKGNDKAAYYCGRLLATLENAQRTALGDVNASLTDRYYGSAASTPSKIFAVLLRNSRAHLSKLRNERPTAGAAIDKRIEEVMAHLSTFPISLTMQQQGIFALGYYHQRADDRASAILAKAKRDAQITPASEPNTSNEGA